MGRMATEATTSLLATLIRERRSIRAFQELPVAREVIAAILSDAAWAPSPHNVQPWRFTVLTRASDKHRLAAAMADRLAKELAADEVPSAAIAQQISRSQQRICTAPVVILCSICRD